MMKTAEHTKKVQGVEIPPKCIYHRGWFTLKLERSAMKRVNVFSCYRLGALLQAAREVRLSSDNVKVVLDIWLAMGYLGDFLKADAIGLSRSKESANKVLEELQRLTVAMRENRPLEDCEIQRLWALIEDFDAVLESESQKDLRIFSVTPKGIYDTTKLVDSAEDILGESILSKLPKEIGTDVNLAGRCLAFELWTATGFHAMRAVEAIARKYHQVATKNPPIPEVPLGGVITELEKQLQKEEGAKVTDSPLGLIIATLRRLNKVYRIPVMHPNMTLTPEDAKRVFELATSVIPMICEDLTKRSETIH